MSPEPGDRTNHCRRLLTRGRVQVLGETLFPSQRSLLGREPIAKLQRRLQHQTPFSCRRAANLKKRRQPLKKTSNSTPVGKEGSHRLGKLMYRYSFLFQGNSGPGYPLLVSCAFVFACLSVVYCCYQVIPFLRAGENMGREEKNNKDRNRRTSIFLPNNLLKTIITTATPWG